MANVDWRLAGAQYANCNCAWGCPCQFNALPTYGDCRTVLGIRVDEGHFGEVRLDGLACVGIFAWPGAIHEGNGTQLYVIDERADKDQRHGLLEILYGRETDPGATIFQVFAGTMTEVLEPLFLPIELDIDVAACTARLEIPGLVQSTGTPIISPFSGEPHRARVTLERGMSYVSAEFGSGSTKAEGPVPLDFADTYGQFNHMHLTQHGVVR